MLTSEELNRLENFGFTAQKAAIVDAIWFNGAYTSAANQIGMVLICNPAGIWKAYIGGIESPYLTEKECAQLIANRGAKVLYAIAAAAFPNRFEAKDYDKRD
jgi:hypothetical protein